MKFIGKLLPLTNDFNKPTTSTTVSTANSIDTYFLVDKQTRHLMFLFTLYFPYENKWMSVVSVNIYIFI
jgi:hypothetical protein